MGFGTEATSGQKEKIFNEEDKIKFPNLDQKVMHCLSSV